MALKFRDYKEDIIEKLNKKIDVLGIKESYTIIDGLFNFELQQEMDGGPYIGGPTVPMIGIVGNESLEIHFFAVKPMIAE